MMNTMFALLFCLWLYVLPDLLDRSSINHLLLYIFNMSTFTGVLTSKTHRVYYEVQHFSRVVARPCFDITSDS